MPKPNKSVGESEQRLREVAGSLGIPLETLKRIALLEYLHNHYQIELNKEVTS